MKTFFSKFSNPRIIDLPGFNYDLAQHAGERELMKKYFTDGSDKEAIRKEYNSLSFKHHKDVKDRFAAALSSDHDLVVGYFSVIDVIGHTCISIAHSTKSKSINHK